MKWVPKDSVEREVVLRPCVVRWMTEAGVPIVGLYDGAAWRLYSPDVPHGTLHPNLHKMVAHWPSIDDGVIAELLALKANPTETVEVTP